MANTERKMNKYIHKFDMEYNRLLLENSNVEYDAKGVPKFDIKPHDMKLAKDYLMLAMYGFSQDELDNLGFREYEDLMSDLDKYIEKEKKGS